MGKILYSVARTESGEVVNAADAERIHNYYCRFCSGPFVLRKSGKIGPGSKRPHFAHKALDPNCTPESALHFEFKNRLSQIIQEHLSENKELCLSWKCIYCDRSHTGNLLKTARKVELEHCLDECRPDLSLLDKNGRLVAAIEVVVTHKPEEGVREFYRQNNIALVELHLTSETDLDNITDKLAHADAVDICLESRRCSRCSHFQQPILMRIIHAAYYSCKAKMRVPFIEGDEDRGSYVGPERFSNKEREIAKSHGARIEWQDSRTLNTSYWAATCGRCNKFIGSHYLFTDYICCATSDEIKDVPLGCFCTNCARIESEDRSTEDPRETLFMNPTN